MTAKIYCAPYACTLAESACAARYARTLAPTGRAIRKHTFGLCAGCADGAARHEAAGAAASPAESTAVRFAGSRGRSLEVYVPRRGLP